jgi:hypothetical protein
MRDQLPPAIYRNLGGGALMRESRLQSFMKPSRAVVAQYSASQLITQREVRFQVFRHVPLIAGYGNSIL